MPKSKAMTKTEKLTRVRSVRAKLSRFIDLQDGWLQDHVKAEGKDPDYWAMNYLLRAKTELDALITDLRQQRYGAYGVRGHRGLHSYGVRADCQPDRWRPACHPGQVVAD